MKRKFRWPDPTRAHVVERALGRAKLGGNEGRHAAESTLVEGRPMTRPVLNYEGRHRQS